MKKIIMLFVVLCTISNFSFGVFQLSHSATFSSIGYVPSPKSDKWNGNLSGSFVCTLNADVYVSAPNYVKGTTTTRLVFTGGYGYTMPCIAETSATQSSVNRNLRFEVYNPGGCEGTITISFENLKPLMGPVSGWGYGDISW